MKIDWKRKLTSRKMWSAIVSFVTLLMIGLGFTESVAAQAAQLRHSKNHRTHSLHFSLKSFCNLRNGS